MGRINPNIDNEGESQQLDGKQYKERLCGSLPFILRAWWLRDTDEYADLFLGYESLVTGPVWSSFSDPACDLGNIDYGDEPV